MQKNMLYKWLVDIVSIVFTFIVMAYRLTENNVHELFGLSLLLLFIIHQLLNRQWYKNIFQGSYNTRRVIVTTVNLFMLLAVVAIIITAVPISRTIFAFLQIQNGMLVSQVHIFAAHWLFVLLSIHLGLHGAMIINKTGKFLARTNFVKNNFSRLISRALIITVVIYGIYSSGSRNIGSKLIMYYTFDAWRLDDSLLLFLTDYLSIMLLYASGTYYLVKQCQHQSTQD